jgi:hypothetical protein
MNRRGKRKSAGGGSDRKHLTGLEVERLIAATRGSRNEACGGGLDSSRGIVFAGLSFRRALASPARR